MHLVLSSPVDSFCPRDLVRPRLSWSLLVAAVLVSLLPGCDSGVPTGRRSSPQPHNADRPAAVETDETNTASNGSGPGDAGGLVIEPLDYAAPEHSGFLGDDACRECHQEINERFASHPMSQSITPVDPQMEAARLAAAPNDLGTAQHHYRVSFRGSEVWHTERMLDSQGKVLFEQGVPVDYAIGSGRRAIAYMSERDNLLLMSPLNWYRGQQGYDFAPSHSLTDTRRFSRRVNDDCLSCHAGRVAPLDRNSSRYREPSFLQMAIGCENCHGPGAAHVEYQSALASQRAGGEDPIVNPMTLDHQRREAVCYQCHLHSQARVLRPERSHYDYRPGDHLDDIWAHMVRGSGIDDGKTKAVAHVQQMHASVCFQASLERPESQRMGCISCHDPHSVPQPQERITFYRDRCLQCHQQRDCTTPTAARDAVSDSCIACHMPSRAITDIAHTSQTDHRILRNPSPVTKLDDDSQDAAEDARRGRRAGGELMFFWNSAQRLPHWEQQRTRGMGQWLLGPDASGRPRMSILENLLPIAEQRPVDGPVQTVLGAFWMQYQRPERALGHFEQALKDQNVQENARSNLLTIYYLAGQWQQALAISEQLLAIDPEAVRVHALRADIFDQLGDSEAAVQSAETALQLNPKLNPVRQWLISKYQSLGNQARAAEHTRLLDAIERIRSGNTAP